jgi:hypothetical protein
MKVGELIGLLSRHESDTEVVIQASGDEIEDGDLLDIAHADSVKMTFGKVVIVADFPDEDDDDE